MDNRPLRSPLPSSPTPTAEDPRYESRKYDQKCGTHVERFLRCLAKMEELPGPDRPDFALIVGDVHPHELRKHMARVRMPLHAIAGNHENRARREVLREMFPEDFQLDGKPSDYYSFVHKGCRFIGVCDAGCGGDHVGHLCSEEIKPAGQCEWLEGELAQHESYKFIFAHIPPHPNGLDKNGYLSRNDSRYLNDLVARTRPTAMFFGHQHAPTRKLRIGSTPAFVVRSCAWNFGNAPLGFLLVKVSPAGIETKEIITSPQAVAEE